MIMNVSDMRDNTKSKTGSDKKPSTLKSAFRLLGFLLVLLLIGFGVYAYSRLSQKALKNAFSNILKEGGAKEIPVWFPKSIYHPCSKCGDCVHELVVNRNHLELTVLRSEKELFSDRTQRYYFSSLEDFVDAMRQPNVFEHEAQWHLRGYYKSPHGEDICDRSKGEFLRDFVVKYDLFPYVDSIEEKSTEEKIYFPKIVPFVTIGSKSTSSPGYTTITRNRPEDEIKPVKFEVAKKIYKQRKLKAGQEYSVVWRLCHFPKIMTTSGQKIHPTIKAKRVQGLSEAGNTLMHGQSYGKHFYSAWVRLTNKNEVFVRDFKVFVRFFGEGELLLGRVLAKGDNEILPGKTAEYKVEVKDEMAKDIKRIEVEVVR
jgi:hypothetical protein